MLELVQIVGELVDGLRGVLGDTKAGALLERLQNHPAVLAVQAANPEVPAGVLPPGASAPPVGARYTSETPAAGLSQPVPVG